MAKKKAAVETTPEEAPINFESALEELEGLVTQMEDGDLSLEDSLKAFERGVALTRQCQTALADAELKVKVLTADNKFEDLTFDDEDDDIDFDED